MTKKIEKKKGRPLEELFTTEEGKKMFDQAVAYGDSVRAHMKNERIITQEEMSRQCHRLT